VVLGAFGPLSAVETVQIGPESGPARRMYHPLFTLICRDFYGLTLREEPLATQKVEGSSPFSRSLRRSAFAGLLCLRTGHGRTGFAVTRSLV
jgi:hypothetical protein